MGLIVSIALAATITIGGFIGPVGIGSHHGGSGVKCHGWTQPKTLGIPGHWTCTRHHGWTWTLPAFVR